MTPSIHLNLGQVSITSLVGYLHGNDPLLVSLALQEPLDAIVTVGTR